MLYSIPKEHFYRLHHGRPRFKSDLESVILFLADSISSLSQNDSEVFNEDLRQIIRSYPGNFDKADKTIANWQTEISALLGMIEFDRDGKLSKPGSIAVKLANKQDLIQFFRYFLWYFQYPGGYLKPHQTKSMIEAGIRFKPVPYLINVMREGTARTGNGNSFGISKDEAAHCIFNDTRVTVNARLASDTAQMIIDHRSKHIQYDNTQNSPGISPGDVVRYAGDILDYMQVAGLTRRSLNGQYYLQTVNSGLVQAFSANNSFFPLYESLYQSASADLKKIDNFQDEWFRYVNNIPDDSVFETDILQLIGANDTEEAQGQSDLKSQMASILAQKDTTSTVAIGNLGENLTILHEKNRLQALGRTEQLNHIVKIPEHLAHGYDIQSYNDIGPDRRHIEVKTTLSFGHLDNFGFGWNEWNSAQSHKEKYYVYRIQISHSGPSLFIIQDPVAGYKAEKLNMYVNKNGTVQISHFSTAGTYEDLLH